MSAPADTEKPAHFAMDWLQAYGDRLYSYAVARVSGDQAVAEDLVQETLLAAIKAYPRFKGESTLETWLIGILRRKVIDRYRKASRRLEADGAEHGESSDGLFDSRGSLVDVIKWKGATSEQVQSPNSARFLTVAWPNSIRRLLRRLRSASWTSSLPKKPVAS